MSFTKACKSANANTIWIGGEAFAIQNTDGIMVEIYHGELSDAGVGKTQRDLSNKSAGIYGVIIQKPKNYKFEDFYWRECAVPVYYNNGECVYSMEVTSALEQQSKLGNKTIELTITTTDMILDPKNGEWRGVQETRVI